MKLIAASGGDSSNLSTWLRSLGHSGYIAEGVIYALIGAFALLAAFEPSQQPDGTQGVLAKLEAAPFGGALLGLLALGLAAYVLWQLVLAILDPVHQHERRTIKRRAVRLGCLFNGALHGFLVGEALWLLLGLGATSDDGRSQALWTARAMALPFGRWVIGGTGVGIAIFGLFQFYRAATGKTIEQVDLRHANLRPLIIALGAFGFLARGILFGVIGVFLIDAARRYSVANATGIAGALSLLKRFDSGHWLLALVGAGLISYGLFQIIKEPYRNFRAS